MTEVLARNRDRYYAVNFDKGKRAGFGNRTTYRQAKSVVTSGTPELVAAMDSGRVAISTAAMLR